MPRRKQAEAPAAAQAPGPVVISPNAVFTLRSLQGALGLRRGCLPREIRLKRLRACKRANKYLILGKDVLAWIEGGALDRPPDGQAA